MLGGHQRANEVKGTTSQGVKGLGRVVALVEDEGDVLAAPGQLAITLGQLLRDALKGGGIGEVARIDQMKERHVKVRADQHPQADLAQVAAVLLVVAAGRQAPGRARVDKSKEVGAIIHQQAQREVALPDEALGERLLDGLDVGLGHSLHVVPEGLAGELVSGSGEQARQNRMVVPVGQLGFAGGVGRPIESRQQEILACGQALVALGNLGIDELDQADLLGLVVERGDIAEAAQAGGFGPERRLRLGEGLQDVVEGAEIGSFDDFGFTVHALALTGIVVGAAADDFRGERGHDD